MLGEYLSRPAEQELKKTTLVATHFSIETFLKFGWQEILNNIIANSGKAHTHNILFSHPYAQSIHYIPAFADLYCEHWGDLRPESNPPITEATPTLVPRGEYSVPGIDGVIGECLNQLFPRNLSVEKAQYWVQFFCNHNRERFRAVEFCAGDFRRRLLQEFFSSPFFSNFKLTEVDDPSGPPNTERFFEHVSNNRIYTDFTSTREVEVQDYYTLPSPEQLEELEKILDYFLENSSPDENIDIVTKHCMTLVALYRYDYEENLELYPKVYGKLKNAYNRLSAVLNLFYNNPNITIGSYTHQLCESYKTLLVGGNVSPGNSVHSKDKQVYTAQFLPLLDYVDLAQLLACENKSSPLNTIPNNPHAKKSFLFGTQLQDKEGIYKIRDLYATALCKVHLRQRGLYREFFHIECDEIQRIMKDTDFAGIPDEMYDAPKIDIYSAIDLDNEHPLAEIFTETMRGEVPNNHTLTKAIQMKIWEDLFFDKYTREYSSNKKAMKAYSALSPNKSSVTDVQAHFDKLNPSQPITFERKALRGYAANELSVVNGKLVREKNPLALKELARAREIVPADKLPIALTAQERDVAEKRTNETKELLAQSELVTLEGVYGIVDVIAQLLNLESNAKFSEVINILATLQHLKAANFENPGDIAVAFDQLHKENSSVDFGNFDALSQLIYFFSAGCGMVPTELMAEYLFQALDVAGNAFTLQLILSLAKSESQLYGIDLEKVGSIILRLKTEYQTVMKEIADKEAALQQEAPIEGASKKEVQHYQKRLKAFNTENITTINEVTNQILAEVIDHFRKKRSYDSSISSPVLTLLQLNKNGTLEGRCSAFADVLWGILTTIFDQYKKVYTLCRPGVNPDIPMEKFLAKLRTNLEHGENSHRQVAVPQAVFEDQDPNATLDVADITWNDMFAELKAQIDTTRPVRNGESRNISTPDNKNWLNLFSKHILGTNTDSFGILLGTKTATDPILSELSLYGSGLLRMGWIKNPGNPYLNLQVLTSSEFSPAEQLSALDYLITVCPQYLAFNIKEDQNTGGFLVHTMERFTFCLKNNRLFVALYLVSILECYQPTLQISSENLTAFKEHIFAEVGKLEKGELTTQLAAVTTDLPTSLLTKAQITEVWQEWQIAQKEKAETTPDDLQKDQEKKRINMQEAFTKVQTVGITMITAKRAYYEKHPDQKPAGYQLHDTYYNNHHQATVHAALAGQELTNSGWIGISPDQQLEMLQELQAQLPADEFAKVVGLMQLIIIKGSNSFEKDNLPLAKQRLETALQQTGIPLSYSWDEVQELGNVSKILNQAGENALPLHDTIRHMLTAKK